MDVRRAFFALAVVFASACSPSPAGPPNVVLVSIDTLRADALGAYGGPVATPVLDGLAAEGVLFEQAIAAAPETAPSHATLFTGQAVQRHGLVRNGIPLPDSVPTLTESFRAAGYATGGFVSSFVLDPRFGWKRGFDAYDAELPRSGETIRQRTALWKQHEFEGFDRRADATNARVLPWLSAAPEPFFLFVHYYDPHLPYIGEPEQLAKVPPAFARQAARQRIAALRMRAPETKLADFELTLRRYQAEVLHVDRALGELLAALDGRGLRERTLLVVTSDHGEGLGQHGSLDHAPHLYEEQLRVPLLFRWPGRLPAGRRVEVPVGLVDVAATVVELANLDGDGLGEGDGRSLAGIARDGENLEPRPLLGRRRAYPKPFLGHRGTKFFVRTDRWKYIRASEDPDELYDLGADRLELANVHDHNPDVVRELLGVLDAHLAAHPTPEEAPDLSPEERRGLEALGYHEPAPGDAAVDGSD